MLIFNIVKQHSDRFLCSIYFDPTHIVMVKLVLLLIASVSAMQGPGMGTFNEPSYQPNVGATLTVAAGKRKRDLANQCTAPSFRVFPSIPNDTAIPLRFVPVLLG